MDFIQQYGGTFFVGALLLAVIYWAIRQLKNKKVQCMSCPVHEHCHKENCKH